MFRASQPLVQVETFAKSKTANVTLARVDQNVNVSSQQLKHMELARQQTTETVTDKNQADLQPSSIWENMFKTMDRACVPYTGDWIRQEDQFTSWVNDNNSILLIAGNSGARNPTSFVTRLTTGDKSVSEVCESDEILGWLLHLQRQRPKTRSVHQALRDVAFQITQHDSRYAEHAESCLKSPEDTSTLAISMVKIVHRFLH